MTRAYFTQPDGTNVVITNVLLDDNAVLQTVDDFLLNPVGQLIRVFGVYISTALESGLGHPRYFESYYRRVFECPDNVRVFES